MDLEEDYNLYDDLTTTATYNKRSSIDSLIGTQQQQQKPIFELDNLDEVFN